MSDTELSAGSGREIALLEDTNSAVVQEVVSQLNQAELPIVQRFAALGNGLTARIAIGLWRHNAWIRDIFFVNDNAASTLTNANTDMALIKYAAGAIDFAAAGTYLFRVEGFNTGAFPAKTNLFAEQFIAGTNCTAVSGTTKGILINAGELLAFEFINNEGGARNLIVGVTMVMTDYLKLFSSHLNPAGQTPEENNDFLPHRANHVAPGFKAASGQTLLQEPSPLYFKAYPRSTK